MAGHTLKTPNDNAQHVQLPPRAHPDVQHCAHAPEQHAARHPGYHAILAPQRGARGLQADKEGEEEGDGGVEVALGEADVGCEVCGFCIADLVVVSRWVGCYHVNGKRYVGLVERVEQE